MILGFVSAIGDGQAGLAFLNFVGICLAVAFFVVSAQGIYRTTAQYATSTTSALVWTIVMALFALAGGVIGVGIVVIAYSSVRQVQGKGVGTVGPLAS